MLHYKTGNDFSSDIKRQIRAVRDTVAARQARAGGPALGAVVLEPRTVPVLDADGRQAYHEAIGEDPFTGEPCVRRVPTQTVKMCPVPARIRPEIYHRLGGVS